MKTEQGTMVVFGGWPCWIRFKRYPNNRIAIQLECEEGPMCTATVNVPEFPIFEDEVIIKDYSENKGVLEALISAGVIKDTGRRALTGYAISSVCKLLIRPE